MYLKSSKALFEAIVLGMTKTKEELEQELIEKELRGGEESLSNERVPEDANYEGDQDITDTTPEEAMKEADEGKGIIDKMRHGV